MRALSQAKKLGKRAVRAAGYEIHRKVRTSRVDGPEPSLMALVEQAGKIPGMVPVTSGQALYWLAYTLPIDADVIEIGSWQGRSTAFLAAACRDATNGRVHAIDHFKGNPGKEARYVVGRDDLTDLHEGFLHNMDNLGLTDWVEVHKGRSEELIDDVRAACGGRARLLFIDGEHAYDAVTRELRMYAPMVQPGGMVVFDDYSPMFPGVVEAVREFVDGHAEWVDAVQADHQLVVRRQR